MSDKNKPKIITRRNFFTLAGLTSITAGGLFIYSYTQEQSEIESAPKDMAGNSITLDIPLTDDEIDQMNIEPLSHVSVVIEELGLDSLLSTMNSVNGVINPPDATRSFLLKDYGTSLDNPEKGTLYVVAHSLKSGVAPGNYLFDWNNDKILVEKGNIIKISELQYKVSSVELSEKTSIGDHKTIWNNTPETLVFITCLQRQEGRSIQNLIVVADRIQD